MIFLSKKISKTIMLYIKIIYHFQFRSNIQLFSTQVKKKVARIKNPDNGSGENKWLPLEFSIPVLKDGSRTV